MHGEIAQQVLEVFLPYTIIVVNSTNTVLFFSDIILEELTDLGSIKPVWIEK